jgi:hypothetical protein
VAVAETVTALSGFPARGAGSNDERRAARYLARELRRGERQASIETFWSRPNWALAQAWHAALAAAGSLVSVASSTVGGAIVIAAVLSMLADFLTGHSPGRRLTPERASQNVVSPPPAGSPAATLIVTANYDAGRMGLVYQPGLRRTAQTARRLLGPLTPGWLGWLVILAVCILVTAALRHSGQSGTALSVAQLIPTAGLVLAFALLLELGVSSFGPAANDNASGVAVAIALARALDVSPPRRMGVELVLQGAGDGSMAPLRRHLRRGDHAHTGQNTIVLGIAAAGGGRSHYWTSDGPLVPLRFTPRLAELAQASGNSAPGHGGRGLSPAFAARFARLPSITIGSLDQSRLPAHSHLPGDVPAELEPGAADRLLELALILCDAIDASLPDPPAPGVRPRRPTMAS